jgi:hypothetical protein
MTSYETAFTPVPKRIVPWNVIWHLVLSGRFFQLGIIPLFAGIALVYCYKPVIAEQVALSGPVASTAGRVTLSEDTGQTHNSDPIYVNFYTYTTPDAVTRKGVSYGMHVDPTSLQPVTVLYSVARPDLSHIVGMKPTLGSIHLSELSVVPLVVGVVMVLIGFYESYKLYYLLRQGKEGAGPLADKVQTNKSVNQHPVYQYFYNFTTPKGQVKKLTVSTFEWLSDSQSVLYTDKWNEFCQLTVGLPGKLIIANGQITSHSNLSQTFIIPTIAIALSIAIVAVLK